jgi:hypothetical protein
MSSQKRIEPAAEITSDPHWKPFIAFINEFAKESDRAAVVLGAAKLDQLLYDLLQRTLLPCPSAQDDLLDTERPLGTFSARINACHRIGLIDVEMARAVHLVRRIRNDFAHEVSASNLASGPNRDRIKALAAPMQGTATFEMLSHLQQFAHVTGESKDFRVALALICARLEGAVTRAKPLNDSTQTHLIPKAWRRNPVKPEVNEP